CSDGALTPTELIERAVARGVGTLAITDHDTVAAWPLAAASAPDNLALICGIELSARWGSLEVHVVGLNIAPETPRLVEGIARQRAARDERARRIAHRLARRRVPDPLAGARRHASDAVIGRPHFAAHLVACGLVPDRKTAFKRYLGQGKVGDVRTEWPDLATVTGWIHAAGGQAVLAHPMKYTISATKRRALLTAFRDGGGDAVEVVSGHQHPDMTAQMATLCRQYDLMGSTGSDFHSPQNAWSDLGLGLDLPRSVTPVWAAWA
ncbi:MAG: PHP domain-containing protein, partial [Pseudomonadota bacterium]